jgi:hypothetical protein
MGTLKTVIKAACGLSDEDLIEQVLNDVYGLAKKKVDKQIKLWHIKKSTKQLIRHCKKIRLVKTLWQVDKAVDLKDFYCDSHLILDKKRTKIHNISDFGARKRILISGIAGQGKSIFLRYLCSNTLSIGGCIPIFIEMRRISSLSTICTHAKDFFQVIGCPVDDQIFSELLKSGKIILFLDGFDEVAETEKSRIINDIEHLALAHDELRILVTSRPESGLEVSPLFEVVKLDNLTNEEYREVIKKLAENKQFAENLIKQVEAHKSRLYDLLCTPLLVTLLVMSYKSFQELPEQLSEFYDSIFQVLLQRHDGVKPGFKRQRRCIFNDNQYRSVFEGLCYESKSIVKSIFTYDDISGFAAKSLAMQQLTDDPDKYVDDIVKVTCLILKDGKDYRFIHKSVQEYYAAAFIKHRPEPVAKRYYEQIISKRSSSFWQQEMRFLSEIDKYRYSKYYYLPYLSRILNCTPSTLPATIPIADTERVLFLVGDCRMSFGQRGHNPMICYSIKITPFVPLKYFEQMFQFDFSSVMEALETLALKSDKIPESDMRYQSGERYDVTVKMIIEHGLLLEQFTTLVQSVLKDAFNNAHTTEEYLRFEEELDISISI